MDGKGYRVHWITPLVILVLLSWNAWVSWTQLGKLIYLGMLAFPFLIILLMSIFQKPLPIDFLVEKAKLSKYFNCMFIPGWRLLQDDHLEQAKEGPTGFLVSLNALLVLIFIMTGMAFFSATETLIKVGLVPSDWFVWSNRQYWLSLFIANGFVYVLLSLLVNLLTAHTFLLGYQLDSVKYLRGLTRYFGLASSDNDQGADSIEMVQRKQFWSEFSKHLDNIYGHKVWSGKKIYTLLEGIRKKREMLGTSQWFLLEFAADVLDHHVAKDNLCIRMSYDNPEEYSQFLTRTMSYCSKSIIWIVDRQDFIKILFPIMVREVLFSLAQKYVLNVLKESSKNDKSLVESLSEITDAYKNEKYTKAAAIRGFCQICHKNDQSCKQNTIECSINIKKDKEEVWLPILNDFRTWAINILKSLDETTTLNLCTDETVWELCNKRHTDSLGFPHIRSYYEHRVPKSRIIELPPLSHDGNYITPNIGDDSFVRIVDRLFLVVEQLKETKETEETKEKTTHTNSKVQDKLKQLIDHFVPTEITGDKVRKQIFLQAWRLFGHLSNNESMQRVVGFAEVMSLNSGVVKQELANLDKQPATFDIGIYDHCVMVNSRKPGNIVTDEPGDIAIDEPRNVVWTVVEGLEIQKALSVFDPTKDRSDQDAKKVFPLSSFIKGLEKELEQESIL